MTAHRIGVGCDHAGLELKQKLAEAMATQGIEVVDFGTHSTASCDYPDFAHALCAALEAGRVARGVLVCGTGVGMSIAANRHPGVRAIVCSESVSARMSRKHNDANVLCLGARIIGIETALDILHTFLTTEFEGGRHLSRIQKLAPA